MLIAYILVGLSTFDRRLFHSVRTVFDRLLQNFSEAKDQKWLYPLAS
jgi:hypothetical protein